MGITIFLEPIMVSCFRNLTWGKTLEPHTTQKDFTFPYHYPAYKRPGYNLYLFDIRYHQAFVTPQTVKIKLDFSLPVDAAVGLTAYALLLTNTLKSFNSDEQKQIEFQYMLPESNSLLSAIIILFQNLPIFFRC